MAHLATSHWDWNRNYKHSWVIEQLGVTVPLHEWVLIEKKERFQRGDV